MKKFIIIAVITVALMPVISKYRPRAVTFERAKTAFEDDGLTIADYRTTASMMLDSIAQVSFHADSAQVSIYQYDGEGKIAVQMGYQQQDPGAAIVAGWGLAQSLGAAQQEVMPESHERNGMFMIIVRDYNDALRKRIIGVFRGL